jgi:hypothetical protein
MLTEDIRVQLVGNSRRLSKGVQRYVSDLKSSLADAGVKVSESRESGAVVHAVSPVFFPRGHPFVVTVGDIAPLSKGNAEWVDYNSLYVRIYQTYFSQIVSRSFRHADAVISLSSQTTEEIASVFPDMKDKVRTISPGISERFRPLERSPHEGVRIGYYREISPMMAKMIELLREAGVSFTLHSLTGVADDHIVEYYNFIDYFVDFMPYRGFGYPLVESRACGASLLLRKDAKIPAEVKALAMLVEDGKDAAERIRSRVMQPHLSIPFTLKKMASETTAVYQELLGLRHS